MSITFYQKRCMGFLAVAEVSCSNFNLSKLQCTQNLLARTVLAPWSVCSVELTRMLHWLPVKQQIHYQIDLLCYKAKHSLAPTLRLSTSQINPLIICPSVFKPAVSSYFALCTFSIAVPLIWNSLELGLCFSSSFASFKSHLKTTIFSSADIT